jgi:hypothetical protein
VVVVVLAVLPVSAASASTNYSGKTSQGQPVSFTVSHGAVANFKIIVNDRCPDGHTLSVTNTYFDMRITNGAYGGHFAPTPRVAGEQNTISGHIRGNTVSGTITDTSFSHREGRLCIGKATWSLSFAKCSPPSRLGNDNPPLGHVTATNMSCAAARHAMRIGNLQPNGGFRTPGFTCRRLHRFHVGNLTTGATNRCTSGRRAFQFDWAT